MNCREAVASLIASLENATPMSDAAREHISGCERCAELLDSAREFQTSLHGDAGVEPAVEPATARAEDEVLRAGRRRLVIRIGGAIALVAVILTAAAIAQNALGRGGLGLLEIAIVACIMAAFVAIPLLLLLLVTRAIVRPRTGTPLYKRLGPGRMLDGVALGLSEATKVNVSLLRLIFLGLFFFDGVGLILYVLLDVFMPVHPDDRQHLLRFKLRRWLRRSPAAPDAR